MTSAGNRKAPGPKRLLGLLGVVIGVLGVVFVGRLVWNERSGFADALGRMSWTSIVGALVCGVAAMGLIGRRWLTTLDTPTTRVDRRRGMAWYYVGQLGKYVPGGIWPVVGRAELATRGGVDRRRAYSTTAVSMMATYAAAAVLGLGTAPLLLDLPIGVELLVCGLVVALAAVAVHPAVIGLGARLAHRLTRRRLAIEVPTWRATLVAIGAHVPTWVLVALATWIVAHAIDVDIPFDTMLAASSLSWLAGFVVVGAPGGLGVRESVFVLLCSGTASRYDVSVVAVVSRLLFITVDLVGAASSSLVRTVATRVSGSRGSAPEGSPGAAP